MGILSIFSDASEVERFRGRWLIQNGYGRISTTTLTMTMTIQEAQRLPWLGCCKLGWLGGWWAEG